MKTKLTKLLAVLFAVSICVIAYAATQVRWDEANKYYGQTVTVTGRIVVTHNSGKACFLNFHQNWKKYFTAVIFASDFHKFPSNPKNYYLNKEVKVTGYVKEYKEKPEIILKDPSQIVIVGDVHKAQSPVHKTPSLNLQEQKSKLQAKKDLLGLMLKPEQQIQCGLHKLTTKERQSLCLIVEYLVSSSSLGDSARAYLINEGWEEVRVLGTRNLKLEGDSFAQEYTIAEHGAWTYILEPYGYSFLTPGMYLGQMNFVSCEIIDTGGNVVHFWTKDTQ